MRQNSGGPVRTVLTYGTFDLLHVGHLRLLERARALGDRLIVGVSTDEFNARKGKSAVMPFAERSALIASLRCVDAVIPEDDWAQKQRDILDHGVTQFVMGDDWAGKFDDLAALCTVTYLSRTPGVSSSLLRSSIQSAAA